MVSASNQLFGAAIDVPRIWVSALSLLFSKIDDEGLMLNSLETEIDAATGVAIEVRRDICEVRPARKPASARPLSAVGIARRHARLVGRVAALQIDPFDEDRVLRRRAITQRLALLIEREKARLADARPFARALDRICDRRR